MNQDRFEQAVAGEPVRRIPPGWRTEILGAARAGAPARAAAAAWRAWLWPAPAAWAALAAGWMLALGLNLAAGSGPEQGPAADTGATRAPGALAERRAWMNELAGGRDAPAVRAPAMPDGQTHHSPAAGREENWT